MWQVRQLEADNAETTQIAASRMSSEAIMHVAVQLNVARSDPFRKAPAAGSHYHDRDRPDGHYSNSINGRSGYGPYIRLLRESLHLQSMV